MEPDWQADYPTRADRRALQERADAGLLTVQCPGQTPPVRSWSGETPTDGTLAIATWVALLDRAEAAMDASADDAQYSQRTASRYLDSLYLYEHQMTPLARRLAREYVWLRDRDEPLPLDAERLATWERCQCRRCCIGRICQRPRVAALFQPLPTPHPPTLPTPTPARLTARQAQATRQAASLAAKSSIQQALLLPA